MFDPSLASRRNPLSDHRNHPHERHLFCAATPVFRVPDAVAAGWYYRDVFGFEIAWELGDPPTFVCVQREHVAIFLHQTDDESANRARLAGPPSAADLYVFVEDVDKVYAEFSRSGADCRNEPRVYDYGMKDFEVRDLNGYVLTFGQEAEPAEHDEDEPAD